MPMKVLLIYPYFLEQRIHEEDIRVPPIGLYYVGGMLTAHGHEVKILNWHDKQERSTEIREVLIKESPDVVGVSILHGNDGAG